jgi:hypothetical protein
MLMLPLDVWCTRKALDVRRWMARGVTEVGAACARGMSMTSGDVEGDW